MATEITPLEILLVVGGLVFIFLTRKKKKRKPMLPQNPLVVAEPPITTHKESELVAVGLPEVPDSETFGQAPETPVDAVPLPFLATEEDTPAAEVPADEIADATFEVVPEITQEELEASKVEAAQPEPVAAEVVPEPAPAPAKHPDADHPQFDAAAGRIITN